MSFVHYHFILGDVVKPATIHMFSVTFILSVLFFLCFVVLGIRREMVEGSKLVFF